MKNKLTRKLILYFSFTLLLFSLVIGLAFGFLFSRQTIALQKEEMSRRATIIGDTLSEYFSQIQENNLSSNNHMMHSTMKSNMGMMGYSSFIKFMDQFALDDIWIINENTETITLDNTNMHYEDYTTNKALPSNAHNIVKKVYQKKNNYSEEFRNLLGESTVTVGAPIKNEMNNVEGVVLLHSTVASVHQIEQHGYFLLFISILFAWIIGLLFSIFFSKKFIAPINKMSLFTDELVIEHYDQNLEVPTNDEMGALAQKLTVLKNRLADAKFQRENKDQAQKNFLSTISHELRTPVTVMRGSLESLNDGIVSQPEKIQQYHQQLLNESLVLERLINDLLELSRLENHEFTIIMEPVDLKALLVDSLRSIRIKAAEKSQALLLIDHYEQTIVINGDYGRIRQLFIILLENAVKFAPEHSDITLKIETVGQTIDISVHNNGSVISVREQEEIFHRFHKDSSQNQKEGTGLGLAIAKQIAERHQFILNVQSDLEHGTTFIVSIPLQR